MATALTRTQTTVTAEPVRSGVRHLADDAATAALGARLAAALAPGDVALLSGPLGAGKSALARAVIRARLAAAGAPAEDVPSPTYTLVQTYGAGGVAIRHADLYRLGDPEEAEDLGLLEGLDGAILLVEWPDRLGALTPPRRLEIALDLVEPPQAGRRLAWRAVGDGWAAVAAALTEGDAS